MRVSLARAIAHPSRVLLLDEPLSGLDTLSRGELLPKIAALAPDRTLLHVTHGLDEVAQASTHLLAIVEGRIAAFGPTAEVLKTARSGPVGPLLTSAWP
jgi:molybdate transport system ATP-binding protein